MVDPVDSLRHEHRLLLVRHGFCVLAHDVVEPREHTQTLCDLWVHCAVHIVQQVQCLIDQLVALLKISLLNLALSCRVEVERVTRLKKGRFDS